MKNIFKIFLKDASRIANNVVAIVVIMGLCVLPSLYAWFNIFSNWDPYGPDSTSNLKIAVFSNDAGEDLLGEDLNIGDSVISGLKENDSIGWVFTDTEAEATNGVKSGAYYAALIIPEDFTENMISFLNGDVKNPTITYYENDKKNAIAPKITSKAKTTVQEEVNATFVSTLANALLGVGKVLTVEDNSGANALTTVTDKLTDMDTVLDAYIAVLSSLTKAADAAQNMITATEALLPEGETLTGNGQSIVTDAQGFLDETGQMKASSEDLISYALSSVDGILSTLESGISQNADAIASNDDALDTEISKAKGALPYLQTIFDSSVSTIKGKNTEVDTLINRIDSEFGTLSTALDDISNNPTPQDARALLTQINSTMSSLSSDLDTLQSSYESNIAPQLDKSLSAANSSMLRAAELLTVLNADMESVSPVLESYKNDLSQGTTTLNDTLALANEIDSTLESTISRLNKLSNDGTYQEFIDVLENDPESLGEFISSPVNMGTIGVYPIATYGSAMTPFYTVLALWVGALILVAIIHVKVEPIEGMKIRPYQAFFGRYILFFLIGQVQTFITVMGDLFYIKIQCLNPILFWFAAAVTSFVFTLFIYSLTVAFQNIGEALAVIIMVIQVAGAGGTFPIEVLPSVYQMVYKFLPFPYAMNSMRETIGGMYDGDYWIYLMKLGSYLVLALFIGLVMGKPFRSLNRMIDRSKEKSGLMI